MFRRTSQSAEIYTEEQTAFIASLETLRYEYLKRSMFTFITGDTVINGVDRTTLKARVTLDLINAIKEGTKNIRVSLSESAIKHNIPIEEFLDGRTAELLNNPGLFELLSTQCFSAPTLTETSVLGLIKK